MNDKQIFLETALRISKRITKSALWNGDKCTWKIMTPDRTKPQLRVSIESIASGSIYQGTGGIALFLLELYKNLHEQEIKKTTEGAINYALSQVSDYANNNFAFFSGRTGLSYLLAVSGLYLNRSDYLDASKKIIDPLYGNEKNDNGLDVIGGTAGAIPILIKLSQLLNSEKIIEIALHLGDNAINIAQKEPTGWSWGIGKNTSYRNLCGLAHGASGFGHAFIELYNHTGRTEYLYAAEQSFLYERQFLNLDYNNWPDFRYAKLSEYIYTNEIKKLADEIRSGKLEKYNTTYMNAWCHGAPGIGLTRLRAYEITQNPVYKKEAEIAIEGTLKNDDLGSWNYSLCHGIGGNSELLINASRILNPTYIDKVNKVALKGCEKYENKNKAWPCGTLRSVTDPSLMLGEAGIGYFYLRLYSSNTPSILLPASEKNIHLSGVYSSGYKEIQEEYIGNYFGDTIEAIKKMELGLDSKLFELPLRIGERISDVTVVYENLKEFFNNEGLYKRQQAIEQFDLDRKKYLKTLAIMNYTEEYIKSIIKKNVHEIQWEIDRFVLNEDCELYNYHNNKTNYDTGEKDSETFFLLRRENNRIFSKQIDDLPVSILKSLAVPKTLNEILDELAKMFEDGSPVQRIENVIKLQIVYLYQANIIEIATVIPMELQILDKMQKDLLREDETMSNYEIALNALGNNIRYLKKIVKLEDELYRKYELINLTDQIKNNLNEIHLLHYFQSYFDTELSTVNFNDIIEELENIFPKHRYEIILQQ